MSKKCNRCGREIPDDAIRCPYCTESGIGVDMTGVSLKDGDEADRAYQEAHREPEKKFGAAVDQKPSYHPTSSSWLLRASGRFSALAWLIYLCGAFICFAYLAAVGVNSASVPICIGIVVVAIFAGMAYSAIGAHLKGMADIVDGLEALNKKQ